MAKTTIMDWQRGLLFTDGRFTRELGPGRHRYRRRRTHLRVLDVRPRTIAVTGQELLTADSITLRVSTVATWRISQPLAFLTASADTGQELYTAVQLAIRDAVAAVTFEDVLADRGRLSAGLVEAAAPRVSAHGVELISATVKDLMLPGELRRAATETLLARETGKAELERARAEAAALRTLANAARLLEEHPALLHLRTIQAAATPGTTVVLTPDPARVTGRPPA